jgi:gas vesicle protein
MACRKGRCTMGRFINGMIVGAAIALLVAPKRGDEMRSLVRERLDKLGDQLPGTTPNESIPEGLSEARENVSENLSRPNTKVMGQTKPDVTNKQSRKT